MGDRLDELKANIKAGVGRLTSNARQEAGGRAASAAARARRKTKGVLRQAGGSLREGAGQLTKNERLEAEGKAQKLRGKAERAG